MCWEKHKGVDLKQGDLPAVCRKGGCDAIPMDVTEERGGCDEENSIWVDSTT